MRTRTWRVLLLFLAIGLIPASQTLAVPIIYTFEGVGVGSLDARTFEAEFTITMATDTAGIVEVVPGAFDVEGPSTIDIFGFPQGTFLIPTRVFANDNVDAVGFSRARSIGGADLVDLFDPVFNGYHLNTDFGPIVEPDPVAVNQFANVPLDIGLLTFNTIDIVTFTARTGQEAPEPGALGLLALGLAAGAGWLRRRKE